MPKSTPPDPPPSDDEIMVTDVVLGPFDPSKMPSKGPSAEQIEDWAICMEAAMLAADGHEVRIASWPDRERVRKPRQKGLRTPDCLIEIDGEISAVEVKEFWAGPTGGRQDAEWQRFQDLVRDEVMADVQILGGMVLAQVGFQQWPSQKLLPSVAAAFVEALRSVIPDLQRNGSAYLVRRYPMPTAVAAGVSDAVRHQFNNLEFRLMPGLQPNVMFMASDAMLTLTPGPEYERAVNELLTGAAARQLRPFDRARVCVAAHPPFFATLFRDALLARGEEIPDNWEAVTVGVIGGGLVRVWGR